jgi:hypothetical protein
MEDEHKNRSAQLGECNFGIYFFDTTYGHHDGDEWDVAAEQLRKKLEQEFGRIFERTNIGPGFDIPAFVTWVMAAPLEAKIIGLLLLGDVLNKSMEGFIAIAKKIRPLFQRGFALNRDAAVVLAITAVFDKLGGLPRTVRLVGYRTVYLLDQDEDDLSQPLTEIGKSVPEIHLGMVAHVFQFDAEDRTFRVYIRGNKATVHEMGSLEQ